MKVTHHTITIHFLFLLGLSSCMSWFGDQSEPSETTESITGEKNAGTPEATNKLEQLELKNAKLWTRLDELEETVARQREQLAVLEQSLNLGIKPIQLPQKPVVSKSPPPAANPGTASELPAAKALPAHSSQAPTENFQIKKDEAASPEFEQMFGKAHEKYLAGRFGPAIVDLADMEKKFGQTMAGGIHVYWVGRCWLALKEFSTARSRLEEFLKSNPNSPYAARANVDLAKAEYGAGLNQTALKRLQTVIEKHPYEDAAELARYELEQMKRTL